VGSLAECLAAVAERHAEDRAAGRADGWLQGAGWREAAFGDGAPTAAALDRLVSGRPVALWAYDRHSLWLNSAALAAGGVGPDSDPGPGGVIERDAAGLPSGVLRERAAWSFPAPAATPAERLAAVIEAQRLAHQRGVTAVHDLEADDGFLVWQRLHAERRLTLRVLAAQQASRLDAVLACGLTTGFGDEQLQIGPVKVFMDGTLGSRTARMLEPFTDGGTGVELTGRAALEELIGRASAGGLSVAVHAIGDRANREALDAFEATAPAWRGAELRPRIEHAQLLHPDDVARFGRLGVVASMQPSHAPADRDVADAAWGRANGDGLRVARAPRRRRHARLRLGRADRGARPAGRAPRGRQPDGDDRPAWHPEQAIDARAALEAFTLGPAMAAGWERRLGTLAPGRRADLTVLDGDPVTGPPEGIGSIGVVATMVGGRWVHGRPPW
jgi:predicted amidohydrolase YtcJ